MQDILKAMAIIGALGGILGLILAIAAEVFKVEVDERFVVVRDLLPQYNCGACGFPGCAGLAEGLVSGEVNRVSLCKPSNAQQRQAIFDYMNSTPGPDGKITQVVL